ncbi:unnamed protein product [Rhizophagus irregularis]|nr:unnamed protein product [Rhizophagus irregularis]
MGSSHYEYKLCHVHFQRNVNNKRFSDPIKKKMTSLLKQQAKWSALFTFPYTKQDKSQVKKQLLAINRKEIESKE